MIAKLTVVDGASSWSMRNVGWFFLAIPIAYGSAVVAPLPRYRIRGRDGAFAGWYFVPIILVCPSLIPFANAETRAASAFASSDITFKMVQSFRHWGQGERN
jgi:hypothetical protein